MISVFSSKLTEIIIKLSGTCNYWTRWVGIALFIGRPVSVFIYQTCCVLEIFWVTINQRRVDISAHDFVQILSAVISTSIMPNYTLSCIENRNFSKYSLRRYVYNFQTRETCWVWVLSIFSEFSNIKKSQWAYQSSQFCI